MKTKDESAIRLDSVSKTVGSAEVIVNLSLVVSRNDFVSIKGPSGCGKTTLLRMIAGLDEPTSGKIYLSGSLANDPGTVIPAHDRSIGFLFQELALWPHMTGLEQLEFVWESTRIGGFREKAGEVCRKVGFPEKLLGKFPSRLSRGEQQRLAIARTLISQPRILLLDEPLTALDAGLRELFVDFLVGLKKSRSMTVLVVSHDLMTDRVEYDRKYIFRNNTFIRQ